MPVESYKVTGLYEGLTVSELKARSLDRLKQKRGNYDRYSQDTILAALDDSNREAASILKCLHSFAIIELKEGYSQYKPPTQMIFPKKAYFYQSADSYYELEQKTRHWLDRHKPGWKITDGSPLIMYPGDSWGNLRKVGFYPTPKTDGTSYAASPDTGIYASSSGMTTTGNITGQNNAADPSVCTDSEGRTLKDLGAQVGMMIVNVTDGSSGQITDVTNDKATVTLAGGADNSWDVGDSFTILAGEYGVVTSWSNEEQYLFTAEIGGMVDVSTLENNVYLEYVRRPLPLQFNLQYPEVPPDIHQYLADNVVYLLKRDVPRGSSDYAEAMAGRNAFLEGVNNYIDLDTLPEDDTCMDFNL